MKYLSNICKLSPLKVWNPQHFSSLNTLRSELFILYVNNKLILFLSIIFRSNTWAIKYSSGEPNDVKGHMNLLRLKPMTNYTAVYWRFHSVKASAVPPRTRFSTLQWTGRTPCLTFGHTLPVEWQFSQLWLTFSLLTTIIPSVLRWIFCPKWFSFHVW